MCFAVLNPEYIVCGKLEQLQISDCFIYLHSFIRVLTYTYQYKHISLQKL